MRIGAMVPYPTGGAAVAARCRVTFEDGEAQSSFDIHPERWRVPSADAVASARQAIAWQLFLTQRWPGAMYDRLDEPCAFVEVEIDGTGVLHLMLVAPPETSPAAPSLREMLRAGARAAMKV